APRPGGAVQRAGQPVVTAELAPAAASPAAVAVAGELVDRVLAELPRLAGLAAREQLLAAAWLLSLRTARTRRAYAGDFRAGHAWLAERGLEVLAGRRVHVDLWAQQQLDAGAEAASVRRRLSGIASFYRYAAGHDLVPGVPTASVTRPAVDPD